MRTSEIWIGPTEFWTKVTSMLEVGLAECRNEERKDQSKKETRKLKG